MKLPLKIPSDSIGASKCVDSGPVRFELSICGGQLIKAELGGEWRIAGLGPWAGLRITGHQSNRPGDSRMS